MMATGTGFAVVYMTMMCGLPLALHRDGSRLGWAGALAALSAVTLIAGQRLSLSTHTDPFLRMRSGYALLGAGLLLAGVATIRGSGAGGTSFPCWCGAWATRSSWASRWRWWPSWRRPEAPTAGATSRRTA